MSRRKNPPIKVYVTAEERQAITERSTQASLSLSTYLRNLGLHYKVKGTIDQKAILELLQINADLGRLGGLLKLWLTEKEKKKGLEFNIRALLREISNTKDMLEDKIRKL